MAAASAHEKAAMASKKFLAYLIAEATWKLILVVALVLVIMFPDSVEAWTWWFMLTVVIVAGFLEAGYIGSTAWLDRYVRVAEITVGKAVDILDGPNTSPKPVKPPDGSPTPGEPSDPT